MENNSGIPPRSRRKQRNIWPFVLLFLCFLVAAVAGAMFATSNFFDNEDKKTSKKEIVRPVPEEDVLRIKDKTTVLIMGVDVRKDDVGRSDTLMIATIDPTTDQAALLSIPRDTRVKIRGRGYDKINAAFAHGGEALTEQTVENFLGVDINHYVIVNTKSFVKIIDAIGGIDINVEKRMFYEDPWDDDGGLIIDLYPGEQHMDGQTAVTYVRYRDEEGDIGRVRRQQAFMAACLDKVTSPEIIPQIPTVIREVIDAVETDMTFRELLELAGTLKEVHQNGLETAMVPGTPMYIDGVSYWIPDVEQLRMSIAEALGITIDTGLKEKFEQAASEYKKSIPTDARAGNSQDGNEYIGKPVTGYSEGTIKSSGYANSATRRNSSSGTSGKTRDKTVYGEDSETSDTGNSRERVNSGTNSRQNSQTQQQPKIERRTVPEVSPDDYEPPSRESSKNR